MVDGVTSFARRLDKNLHFVAQLLLANHLAQRTRTQRMVDLLVASLWLPLIARCAGSALGGGVRLVALRSSVMGESVHLFYRLQDSIPKKRPEDESRNVRETYCVIGDWQRPGTLQDTRNIFTNSSQPDSYACHTRPLS